MRSYASMLWSELDVASMIAGADEAAQKLHKMKNLQLLPVYELVDKEIVGFCNSLPLMKELKSEALRCVFLCVLSVREKESIVLE